MASPATTRKQRLRKTKAQLIDEIEMLELRAAAIEATNRNGAPMRAKARDRYLATQELADLARFSSENPSPVLRVMPDGTVLYANDAAIAVNGLLKGRKKSTLVRDLAGACAEVSGTAEVQETEFESGDRVFAISIAPVTGKTYINIYGRDVTDGHNTRLALEAANEASAAAKERLKAIIDNSPATICLKDAKGRYQLVNKHFTELHGMTADAMLGKTAHELFPKEIADPFRAHDQRVLKTGIAEEREQVVTTPGGPRTFNEIKFPITANGEQSTVNTIGLIAIDITERKRAERELAEKEVQLHLALDNMPGGIRLVDNDRNYVFFNQQYLDLYDFPEGLLKVGESTRVENLYSSQRGDFGPGNPDALTDHWQDALPVHSEATSWERTITGAKTLLVRTAPTPDGGFVNIVTDITERKRAEEKLAEKEAQLRLALDNMPGGMRLIDKDQNYVFFNSQYLNLYDFPEGLLKVGESIRVENLYCARRGDMGPGNPEKLTDDWLADSPELMKLDSWERRIGDEKILQVKTSPIPDGGVISIAIDITERKRAEAGLAEKEAQLRAALDNMPSGIRLIDGNRKFVLSNQQYIDLYDFPEGLLKVGDSTRVENLYCARRGDFGPGDPERLVDKWLSITTEQTERYDWERTLESGKVLQVRTSPLPDRGVVNVVTDITARKRAEEQLQAAHTRLGQFSEAVSEYLDPMLVDNLRDGSDVEPRVHFVTVFFADLVGSTRLSREMNEDSFGAMIQEFVGGMQRVIKARRGYLENISGDGIFGYIGNFDSHGPEADATDAVVMAVEMQLRLTDLSNEFQSRYRISEPLRMRIGISSGDALVGKTAGIRAIYTANGDIVNLGAKLEQRLRDLTDVGGILISEQTAALVEGHFALDRHIVTIEGQEMGAYMVDPAQSSTAVP